MAPPTLSFSALPEGFPNPMDVVPPFARPDPCGSARGRLSGFFPAAGPVGNAAVSRGSRRPSDKSSETAVPGPECPPPLFPAELPPETSALPDRGGR